MTTLSSSQQEPELRFGTDGVRGKANAELTPYIALKLGLAAASVLARHATDRRVIVGRDTRISGDMLESALNSGLASNGARVVNVGVIPTPGVSQMLLHTGASAGVVISASHNPYGDNGIKFFGPDGKKLSDEVEEEIEIAMEDWRSLPHPVGGDIGRIEDRPGLTQAYANKVVAAAPCLLHGLKLVLDCANGATYDLAPAIFAELGADVVAIHTSPNGININAHCGSTHPEDMCAIVKAVGADAGLAFDGDGDRVMMCDSQGAMVDGDRMMYIQAMVLKRENKLAGNQVIATIMSNAGLEVALDMEGIHLVRTDVGDRYVAEEMVRSGAVIGGEQSGHLLLPLVTPTGDGMVTGLQVLGAMASSGKTLKELSSPVVSCPQILRNIKVRDRVGWQNVPEISRAIEEARAKVSKPEWLSVRASGTEPLVRVMAQDTDRARVESTVSELCALIQERFGV